MNTISIKATIVTVYDGDECFISRDSLLAALSETDRLGLSAKNTVEVLRKVIVEAPVKDEASKEKP